MYILTNAFKNILRNRSRNLRLGIVMLIIIFASGISIMVHTSATTIIEDYKSRFGVPVILKNQDGTGIKGLDQELLSQIGESELLQKKEFTAKIAYTTDDFTTIDEQENQQDPNDADRNPPVGTLIGTSREDINEDFRKGIKKIISGTMDVDSSGAIISKDLAEVNGLKINDTITLKSTSKKDPLPLSLTITGIYDDVSLGQKQGGIAVSNPSNEIFAAFETIKASRLYQRKGSLDAIFYLKDPKDLSAFKTECIEKGMPTNTIFSVDETNYQTIMKPVEKLGTMANLFTIGILGAGSLILIILSLFSIRERKYEIGVYRAMGMKKIQIILGLWTEFITITAISLILGLGITAFVGRPVETALFQQQAEISEQLKEQSDLIHEAKGLQSVSIWQITLAALLLGTLTSGIGSIFVLRYEPRQILTERN